MFRNRTENEATKNIKIKIRRRLKRLENIIKKRNNQRKTSSINGGELGRDKRTTGAAGGARCLRAIAITATALAPPLPLPR